MFYENHPHTKACIICREDKPLYWRPYSFSGNRTLGLCEDCAKVVLEDFQKDTSEKRIESPCFFHIGEYEPFINLHFMA